MILGAKTQWYGVTLWTNHTHKEYYFQKKGDGLNFVGTEEKRSAFASKKTIWIHLVPRASTFVKIYPSKNQEIRENITKLIQQEFAYLGSDLIYHYSIQKREASSEGVMFGVNKEVLKEQCSQMEAKGIVPERILSSTELLWQLYRTKIMPVQTVSGLTLLIAPLDQATELIYLEGDSIVQSMALPWSDVSSAIHQRKPSQIIMIGPVTPEQQREFSGFGIPAMFVNPWPGIAAPIAVTAAILGDNPESYFVLPEISNKQNEEKKSISQKSLASMLALFCFSIFFFNLVQLLMGMVIQGYFQLASTRMDRSLGELKQLKVQSEAWRQFRAQKSTPLLLVGALSEGVQVGVILKSVDYDYTAARFSVSGVVLDQSHIDQLRTALARQDFVSSVSVERVQSQQSELGSIGYHFQLKGSVKP